MKNRMNRNLRNLLILATVIAVAILATLWATSTSWFPPYQPRFNEPQRPPLENILGDIELFYTVETIVSTVNVTLSIILLLMYVNIYRKTRSEFTIGLIIFSAVLLLHAFVSIPLIHRAFGFYPIGLGPFAMLPDLFTCLALAVLLYLTFKY
jgi:small-conductance mechanosensitive channel